MPGGIAHTKEWPGLAATLASYDDDRLLRLFELRPDIITPAPRDWAGLASRAGSWPSARDAYHQLDRATQRVVEGLCLLPQPAPLAELAALLDVAVDDPVLEPALARLGDRALAFPSDGGDVRLLPALKQVDYPGRLGPPLASLLSSLTGPGVDQMAVRLGLKPARTKPETFALVVETLSDPVAVERLLPQGPPGTAELARRVATEGPLVSVAGGLYSVSDKTTAGWLANRGLLGIADYYTGVMPREPAIALRGGRVFPAGCLQRPPAQLVAVDAATVDGAAAERATHAVSDVVALLEHWSAEPPAVLKAGGLGIREVRKAAKILDRTETEAAHLIELAAVAELVRVDIAGDALPTPAYDEWLTLPSPARWRWLATAWLEADLHLSLAGAISTKDKPIAPLLARPAERVARRRRQLVLAVLAEAEPGSATVPAYIRDRVDWDSPGAWGGGPATPQTLVSWVLSEAQLLGVAARGALSSAGRALVAGRPEDAEAALAALVPPAVAEFVIQADLTAVIAGEPAPAVRTELDLLGHVESKGAATVYRFTDASLRRAFDAGRTADDVLAFFERHATRGVPQPLAYLVADLGRRFGNVRVGSATSYVRSDDPALLAEVLQARAVAKLRLRPLAPTVLVSEAEAATVTSTLQAAGYLPAREAADGTLVLARPPARRGPARPAPAWRPPAPPDPATVVAELRRRPVAPTPAVSFAPAQQHLPEPVWRPTDIARGTRPVRSLLGLACDEFWLVRFGYVDSRGQSLEVTVEPTDVDGRHLYANTFPDGDEQEFLLDRIEWVRVLTEAEEFNL